MDSYKGFAKVYDEFMDQTPYDHWTENIMHFFEKYGIPKSGDILELGCGTGKMSRRLANLGYHITAVDNAQEMLEIGSSQFCDNIIYVLQDMSKLEIPNLMDAAISICDCMNYIIEEEDLFQTFVKVRESLKEEGLFLFDINTKYKYETLLRDNTFAEDREDAAFIWQNFYDYDTRINEYDLTLYVKNNMKMYDKYEEVHFQKAYEEDEIKEMLQKAGFHQIMIVDADTLDTPTVDSERLYFIAR